MPIGVPSRLDGPGDAGPARAADGPGPYAVRRLRRRGTPFEAGTPTSAPRHQSLASGAPARAGGQVGGTGRSSGRKERHAQRRGEASRQVGAGGAGDQRGGGSSEHDRRRHGRSGGVGVTPDNRDDQLAHRSGVLRVQPGRGRVQRTGGSGERPRRGERSQDHRCRPRRSDQPQRDRHGRTGGHLQGRQRHRVDQPAVLPGRQVPKPGGHPRHRRLLRRARVGHPALPPTCSPPTSAA